MFSIENTFGSGELRRQIGIVFLEQMPAKADILRVLRRAHVTRKVPLAAALEPHVSVQVPLHLVRAATLRTLQRRLLRRRAAIPCHLTLAHVDLLESCKETG